MAGASFVFVSIVVNRTGVGYSWFWVVEGWVELPFFVSLHESYSPDRFDCCLGGGFRVESSVVEG